MHWARRRRRCPPRAFTGATLAALLLSLSAFGCLALVSIWLQSVVELDPLGAGLGLLFIGVGGLLLNLLHDDSSWPALLPGLIAVGVGVGLSNPPLTSAALAAVPKERRACSATRACRTRTTSRRRCRAGRVPR